MKALETLNMLLTEYRHDEDDIALIKEAIAELEAMQEENEHLTRMVEAFKKENE